MPTTGVELATATGVYVAASADQKRALRDRYAYRPTEAPETGAATTVEPGPPDAGGRPHS